MLFDLSDFRVPLPAGVQVFASGVNNANEIQGFARLGIPVGVSVKHLNEEAIDALVASGQPVMVDSGAFSEIGLDTNGVRTVKPIGDAEWKRRLALYLRLARALGEQASFVAPDKVGDQHETLLRLARYRAELTAIAATGAAILLPLQVGELPHRVFFDAARNITGLQLVPAMPMRKAATSSDALLSFLEKVKPRHIHLLGIGIENRRAKRLIRAIRFIAPAIFISMDSNRLRAVVGKGRPLTQMESTLREAPVEGIFATVESRVLDLNGEVLDYTDFIALPSEWATPEQLEEIAQAACLPLPARTAFLSSPDWFLQTPCAEADDLAWIEHPAMAYELDRAWLRFVAGRIRWGVRSAAIGSVFQDARIRNSSRAA